MIPVGEYGEYELSELSRLSQPYWLNTLVPEAY